jgi:hypothetical protein
MTLRELTLGGLGPGPDEPITSRRVRRTAGENPGGCELCPFDGCLCQSWTEEWLGDYPIFEYVGSLIQPLWFAYPVVFEGVTETG